MAEIDDLRSGDLGLGKVSESLSLPHNTDSRIVRLLPLDIQRGISSSNAETSLSNSSDESDSDSIENVHNDCEKKSGNSTRKEFTNNDCTTTREENEVFPTYADVAYGTSIQQQKRLFQRNLEKIVSKKNQEDEQHSKDLNSNSTSADSYSEKILSETQCRLIKAQLDIDELHLALENCHRQLEAKYKAIDILREQAESKDGEHYEREQKNRRYIRRLEKHKIQEVNSLQFSLHQQEDLMQSSQEVWGGRFDKLSKENVSLARQHSDCMEQIHRLSAENVSLKREREELLVLIDVHEKTGYERSKSSSSDIAYSGYSPAELAVLGACMCRGSKPDPCGCALAAAGIKKHLCSLLKKLDEETADREKMEQTVEAYREAFEEQLQRNRKLCLKVGELASPASRSVNRTKNIVKWLISNMQERDEGHESSEKTERLLIADVDTTRFSERQLLLLLIDMVNERTQTRAHQKLANGILRKTESPS